MKRREAEKGRMDEWALGKIERIARILCNPIVEALLAFGRSKLRQIYERQIKREYGSEKLFVAVKPERHSQAVVARDKCVQAPSKSRFIQLAVQVQGERFIEAAVRLSAELGCQEDFEL